MEGMRLMVLLTAVVLVVAGCSNATSKAAAASSPSPSPVNRSPSAAAAIVSGGCGFTTAHKGGVPAWLDVAGEGNNPDFLPYVISNPPNAAGFLFGDPLTAGSPTTRANKILWVVGLPRDGAVLVVTGHPMGVSSPTIRASFPADSSPGEIYPSIIDVPTPGCWRLDLSWAGHTAAVELQFR
jgi:hypothetical protein